MTPFISKQTPYQLTPLHRPLFFFNAETCKFVSFNAASLRLDGQHSLSYVATLFLPLCPGRQFIHPLTS